MPAGAATFYNFNSYEVVNDTVFCNDMTHRVTFGINLTTREAFFDLSINRTGTFSGDFFLPRYVVYNGTQYPLKHVRRSSAAVNRYAGMTYLATTPSGKVGEYDDEFGRYNSANYSYTIDNEAFAGCNSLRNIAGLRGCTSVGDRAFAGLPNLQIASIAYSFDYADYTVNFRPELIPQFSLGKGVFEDCVNLDNVDLRSFMRIPENTFKGCRNLRTLTLYTFLVNASALTDCTNLAYFAMQFPRRSDVSFLIQDVDISDKTWPNLTYISAPFYPGGSMMFDYAKFFPNVSYIACLNYYNGTNGNDYDLTSFENCQHLTTIDLSYMHSLYAPDNLPALTTVETYGSQQPRPDASSVVTGLNNCPKLSTVNDLFGNIRNALNNCASLRDISFYTREKDYTIANSFSECPQLAHADLEGVRSVTNSFDDNPLFTSVSAPMATAVDGFDNCPRLTSVSLPVAEKVGGFNRCPGLQALTLPEAAEITDSAFSNNSSMTAVTASKVTKVGSDAFCDNPVLSAVDMPAAETVGDRSFRNLPVMTAMPFRRLVSVGAESFENCTGLVYVNLPELTTLGGGAFSGCSNVLAFQAPEVTTLSGAFGEGMTSLKSVWLPELQSSAAARPAFAGQSSLEWFTWPEGCRQTSFSDDANIGIVYDPYGIASGMAAGHYDICRGNGWSEQIKLEPWKYTTFTRSYPVKLEGVRTRGYSARCRFYRVDGMSSEVTDDGLALLNLRELTAAERNYVPANTPVVVWAHFKDNPNVGMDIRYTMVAPDESKNAWPESWLKAAPAAMRIDKYTDGDGFKAAGAAGDSQNFRLDYTTAHPSGVFVSYDDMAENSPGALLAGHNTYLSIPLSVSGASIRGVSFMIDGATTGIDGVTDNAEQPAGDGRWYRPDGTAVSEPSHGIYIHNGRKVVIP